jgi:putative addiction module component (TIGR02574 family)
MAVSLESFGFDRLSKAEKLELVGRLWDSIVASEPPGGLLTDAQREELRRRVAEAQAHPDDYVTWDEAHTRTMERLSR